MEKYSFLRKKHPKDGWTILKRLSGYQLALDKKESEIASRVKYKGDIFTGNDANKLIAKGIEDFHNISPYLTKTMFPQNFKINNEQALNICRRFRGNKAITFDCVDYNCFKLCNSCISLKRTNNANCKNKCSKTIEMVKNLFDSNFLNSDKSKMFFTNRIVALSKVRKGQFPNPLSEVRIISVASSISKALEASLVDDFQRYFKSNKTNKAQIGCIQSNEIGMHIYRLQKRLHEHKGQGQIIFFLDIKQAFPSAARKTIYKRIEEKNILSTEKLQILKYIHYNTKLKVGTINARATDGVPQGHLLSPFAFLIFIEDLLDELQNKLPNFGKKEEYMICAYVDDIAIWTKNPKLLDKSITIINNWCQKNSIKTNCNKSGIMLFQQLKLNCSSLKSNKMEFRNFPFVKEYRYLGILFQNNSSINNNLSWAKQIKQTSIKIKAIAAKLYPVLNALPSTEKMFLFNTFINPIMDFMSIPFKYSSPNQKKVLERTQRHAFKKFNQINKNMADKYVDMFLQYSNSQRTDKSLNRIIRKCNDWWKDEQFDHIPSTPLPNKKHFKEIWKQIDVFESKINLNFGRIISKLGYNKDNNRYTSLTHLNFKEDLNPEELAKIITLLLKKLSEL